MASDFLYQAKQILYRNPEGSAATQAERRKAIALIDRQLRELGVRKLQLRNLGKRHVDKLLQHWQSRELSNGTIKNRMAHIRWLSEKIGKPGLCSGSNTALGIGRRRYVTNIDKSRQLTPHMLHQVDDPYLLLSFKLQAAFGLRREEAMKIQPVMADLGDQIRVVKTKGGRPREIPIRTDHQRQLLEAAKALAKTGSLIPSHLQYVQQMKRYERACIKMGLDKGHGLRHAYAQERYLELTGRQAPAAGGKKGGQLSEEERARDLEARLRISQELGHGREDVTAVYLGR